MTAIASTDTASALTEALFDGRHDTYHRPGLGAYEPKLFRRPPLVHHADRALRGYDQLRHVAAHAGGTRGLVDDPHRVFALFEWAAMVAPDLLPALSVHNLAVGAIVKLGENRAELADYVSELDDTSSVGGFLLTELGYGSNVFDMETEAVYDHESRGFILSTPSAAAQKFMPNVGANVPKIVIVIARLKVSGEDCGVFPFLLRLRDQAGVLHPGVRVTPLPDRPMLAMDNAVISFDRVRVPYANFLSGGIAEIDAAGEFSSTVSHFWRYRVTIGQLQTGRIVLSVGAVAAARAGVVISLRYAQQRLTAGPGNRTVAMIEHRLAQRSLLIAFARVAAATRLAEQVKDAFAAPEADADRLGFLAMVSKPLLTWTALAALQECRERCGAQGFFSANYITDYLGNAQGAITAEGENQVMQVTAGWRLLSEPAPEAVDANDDLTAPAAWRFLFTERERRLQEHAATSLKDARGRDRFERANDHAAMVSQLADAHAHRLALVALLDAIERLERTDDAELLTRVARLYVLDHLDRHAGWYLAEQLVSADAVRGLDREIDRACAELADRVDALMDAFAVPLDQLDAPMAADDYIAAWDMRSDEHPLAASMRGTA